MTNRAGQQIGNYRLVKLLGTGGFAEVWLGEHVYLSGRQVAIKILHASLPPESERLFIQEAKTVANLYHPHIVQLIDFGIQEGSPYLIMQYAPNGSLRDLYPKGSVVSLIIVVPWVIQIADALQYAHNKGFIHRDVKPENILLSENNQLLLTDFGIATIAQKTELMKTAGYAGTASYSAPEQHRGKPRKESDQYALDVMVYEWFCGQVPFQGSSLTEVALKHLQERPRPLRERVADIPVAVEAVVMKALAKDPKYRFRSIREFAQALQQAATPIVKPPEVETPYPNQPTTIDNKAAVEVLWAKVEELYRQERYEEALVAIDQAISLDPKVAGAYNDKGAALYNLGRYEEALVAFDQAISLDPQNATTYVNRGNTLYNLGRYEEALVAYDQAISLDSQYAVAFHLKGDTLYWLGRHKEALAALDQAISLEPRNAAAYNGRAIVLYRLGRPEEALAALDQVISLEPKKASLYKWKEEWLLYFSKYETLYRLGRYEEALVALDQVISFDPRYASAYRYKGHVLRLLGRHEEAKRAYNMAAWHSKH